MDQPGYIIETLATIQGRIAELKEKADEARDEADHARGVIGLEGAAHAAAAEAARFDAKAADLQKVGECIENGFPYWERAGFEEALDALGEPWRWDTISEVLPPSIVLGHDAKVRIPLDTQRAYAQAIESRLFDRVELCSVFETDGDEVARTTYYLFGAQDLVTMPAALFLVAQW